MKKLILLLPLVVLFSCSIQKRKYQNGFYVDWKHKKTTHTPTASKKEEAKSNINSVKPQTEVYLSSGDKPTAQASAHKKGNLWLKKHQTFSKAGEDSCDLLIFKDGSEIRGKVEEIGINEVKYRRCDAPGGPMYVSKKSDIFMIKYVNGTKEVFKTTEPAVSSYQTPQAVTTYKSNKYNRVNHPMALPALLIGSLSVLVAYIMGVIAIDSFDFNPVLLFIPAILGLIALIIGITAMNRIKEQPDVYKGKGMAIPGFIMGLIIFSIMAVIGLFILAFSI